MQESEATTPAGGHPVAARTDPVPDASMPAGTTPLTAPDPLGRGVAGGMPWPIGTKPMPFHPVRTLLEKNPQFSTWLLYAPSVVALLSFLFFLTFLPGVVGGRIFAASWPWISALDIAFAFRIDGLGLVFALLITGIGSLVFLYTAGYFRTDPRVGRLLTLLFLFGVSMVGLVLADDIVTLFLFWEGTTVTSFLLVGFDYQKPNSRRSALQALLVTGMGGLALLGALILLGDFAGSYLISDINGQGDALRDSALYAPVLLLVLLAAFTKSAQFPFHFWLPGAMAAPTPVSAYLHSATMVKAGVYLLMRFTPALGGTEAWFWILTLFGATTMLIGAIWALRQTDLKLMLAHTTVMGLGTLVMFLGGGTEKAVIGAALFLVVHALYKASLFLMVGCLDKKAGTREVDALGGLAKAMPITMWMAALAALSMAGVMPFVGFLGKEVMYEGALKVATEPVLVTGAALAANAMMVAVGGLVAFKPFHRGPQLSPKPAADPPWEMWSGPMILAVLGLLFGLGAGPLGWGIVGPVASSILGRDIGDPHLALWHGFNAALLLSLCTFALGALFYLNARAIRVGLAGAEQDSLRSADRTYDEVLAGLQRFCSGVMARVQTGALEGYMRITFIALAVVLWGAVASSGGNRPTPRFDLPLIDYVTLFMIIVGTLVVVITRSRFMAITALGVVGTGISMIFVLFGAIDVAMTQLMIEILVVIFLAIALLRLPRTPERKGFRVGDAGIAAAVGLGVTIVIISVLGTPLDLQLTEFFEQKSAPEAFGQNIVNVILVDFRALDTLGEIAVIVIASIGAVAALTAGPRAPVRSAAGGDVGTGGSGASEGRS
ncbi:MAG: hydrogen gas-evolving membrane-bound hydrogenase subunit E [Pseudomonadota bacterium]